jgi:hypothetical protein
MGRKCKRFKKGPSGLKRCASYGATKGATKGRKSKKAVLSKTFPDMRIVFNIEFEDYNLEEDLASGNPYAKQFLKKFDEGAGWSRIQDEEMATLSKLLGFYCKATDSESGEVSTGEGWVVQQRFKSAGRKLHTVETLGDVLKLWEVIARTHGGGDDYIYLDQYTNADNFLLFPEGFNGPRYRYGCGLGEPCWEDWLEEQGAL